MKVTLKDNTLTIVVPIAKPGTPSRSGKTMIAFTTAGYQPVVGTDLRVSVNVIGPRETS